MNDYLNAYILNYATKGIILDTNIFLLYLVGIFDKSFIREFDRTKMFDEASFNLLFRFVNNFKRIITTPNIITELSNFSFKISEPKLSNFLQTFIVYLRTAKESYIQKDILFNNKAFCKVGITDASIIETVKKEKLLVLTTDFELTGILRANKFDVINFNNVSFQVE